MNRLLLASLAALCALPLAAATATAAAASPTPADPGLTVRKIQFAASPRAAAAPVIDGDLGDPCWRTARKLDGFRLTAGKAGSVPRHATTAWVTHDDTHLYLAFECEEPDTGSLKAAARPSDDPDIEYDDRVEVMLDTGHDHRNYWHLALNAAGAMFDQTVFYRLHGARTNETHPERNLRWLARTRVAPGRWFAEIAIDATTLGTERLGDGTTWGFNAGRVRRPDVGRGDEINRWKPGPEAEYSAWAPTRDHLWETVSNFHAPLEFGDLVFGDPGFAVTSIALRSARYTMGAVGLPTLVGENPLAVTLATAGGAARTLLARVTVEADGTAARASETRTTFADGRAARLAYGVERHGENHVRLELADPDTGKVYYKTHYTEEAPPPVDFELGDLYARAARPGGAVRVRLAAAGGAAAGGTLSLEFRAGDGRVLQRASVVSPSCGEDAAAAPVFDLEALRALPGGDYAIACTLAEAGTGRVLATFTQHLTKPDPRTPDAFGAARGPYAFGGLAGEAVRIRFPGSPASFVFWSRACNVPWWDIDQVAVSNEFIEAWGSGTQGCAEPMQDRECRYSRAELVESTPARAVVRWRYALADARYRIHRNEWVEETYVFHPDGVGVRQVRLWANSTVPHEVMELIPVKPPGTRAAELFQGAPASLERLHDGARWTGDGKPGAQERYLQHLRGGDAFIARVRLRDRPQPFTVVALRPDLLPGVHADGITLARDPLGPAEQRGHWPASRWALDGYNAVGRDVPTHFSLGNIHMDVDPRAPGGPANTWTFLLGTAPEGSPLPARHAAAWLRPAMLEASAHEGGPAADCTAGYDPAQRAHRIALRPDAAATTRLVFRKAPGAGPQQAAMHPALLVTAEGSPELATVHIDGKPLPAGAFASGRTHAGETAVFLAAEVPFDATVDLGWRRGGSGN